MSPLPCPFCGADAVARWDGPEARPFSVRCTHATCPGCNVTQTYAEGDVAMAVWNRRAQMPPPVMNEMADVSGFAKKDLIRGELIQLTLDRTGVFVSDKIAFTPWSKPLMRKPQES